MKICTLIPVRSGSKGIPHKNIALIDNKPLMSYAITASVNSKVNRTFISTDSDEYAAIAKEYKSEVIMRPDNISIDSASSEDVLLHFANKINFDILVFMQATSPLTSSEDINNCIDMMDEYDSVLSVCSNHGGWLCGGFTWEDNFPKFGAAGNYNINDRPRRQDMDPSYRENGALYVTTKKALLMSKCRLSGKIGLYIMPRQRSFEIDEPEDLDEIRKLYEK